MANREETADTIMQSIGELNDDFINFQEQWSTLTNAEQDECTDRFLKAQKDFHFVGTAMLVKVNIVQMPPSPPLTEAEEKIAKQLQFGTASSTDATTQAMATGVPTAHSSEIAGENEIKNASAASNDEKAMEVGNSSSDSDEHENMEEKHSKVRKFENKI